MMFWGYGYSGLMMVGMILWNLFWLLLLGLLVWASIRWLGRNLTSNTHGPASEPSALEILRRRYARGEIDAVTFEQMKERLEGSKEQSVGQL